MEMVFATPMRIASRVRVTVPKQGPDAATGFVNRDSEKTASTVRRTAMGSGLGKQAGSSAAAQETGRSRPDATTTDAAAVDSNAPLRGFLLAAVTVPVESSKTVATAHPTAAAHWIMRGRARRAPTASTTTAMVTPTGQTWIVPAVYLVVPVLRMPIVAPISVQAADFVVSDKLRLLNTAVVR